MSMRAKPIKKHRPSSPGKKIAPIAKGEIDVLKVLVKSALSNDRSDGRSISETSFGNIRVDFIRHELFKKGKPLEANAREFQLLRYFLQHEGELISRDQLLSEVWGFEQTPHTRSVDNYILSLRKKIEEDSANPKHILTFRGAGYKFIR